jgi:hypothetical protein
MLDLLKSVGLYLLVVVGGLFCFLSLAPVFGYLPYSDRPGPGWFGRFPGVTWSDFWSGFMFFLGWVALLVPYAVVAGLLLFVIARLLERFRVPRIAVAVVAALLAGFVSGYIVAGIGWYISIAAPPVYFAMILGIVFGAWLLPRKTGAMGHGV